VERILSRARIAVLRHLRDSGRAPLTCTDMSTCASIILMCVGSGDPCSTYVPHSTKLSASRREGALVAFAETVIMVPQLHDGFLLIRINKCMITNEDLQEMQQSWIGRGRGRDEICRNYKLKVKEEQVEWSRIE
jgi:hypothetical protein